MCTVAAAVVVALAPVLATPGVATADPTPDPTPPPATAGPVTVSGIVRAGVGPGCWFLTADDGRHFVLSDAPSPPVGVPVAVHGVADPSELSRCNGGTVLHVTSIDAR